MSDVEKRQARQRRAEKRRAEKRRNNPAFDAAERERKREYKRKRNTSYGECRCGCGERPAIVARKRADGIATLAYAAFVYGHQWRNYVFDFAKELTRRSGLVAGVRAVYGDACVRCGWDQGPCDIAHLRPGRNRLVDVTALCPNCHRLLDRGIVSLEQVSEIAAGVRARYLKSVSHLLREKA